MLVLNHIFFTYFFISQERYFSIFVFTSSSLMPGFLGPRGYQFISSWNVKDVKWSLCWSVPFALWLWGLEKASKEVTNTSPTPTQLSSAADIHGQRWSPPIQWLVCTLATLLHKISHLNFEGAICPPMDTGLL